MSQKNVFSFEFKDELTPVDFQKILIHQNQAIIDLLMLQTSSTTQTVFNLAVIDRLKENLSPFITEKFDLSELENLPPLSDSQKAMLEKLVERQANGEDVRDAATKLGLELYLKKQNLSS